jgi:hypothetical protein
METSLLGMSLSSLVVSLFHLHLHLGQKHLKFRLLTQFLVQTLSVGRALQIANLRAVVIFLYISFSGTEFILNLIPLSNV